MAHTRFVLLLTLATVVAAPLPSSAQLDVVWSRRHGDGTDLDWGNEIAIGPNGSIGVTGRYRGTIDLGGGPLIGFGGDEAFLTLCDADGQHLWSWAFSGTGDDRGESLDVDAAGNVSVTGSFQGSVEFGGGVLGGGSGDAFLAKYDSAGNHLWSQRFGGSGLDSGSAVAFDAAGDIVLVGYFSNGADFGGGPLFNGGGSDIFVAKFDSDGNHLWSSGFGDSGTAQEASGVAVDSAGNIVVTGYFDGTVDLGGGSLISAGDRDVFVSRYDGSGNHVWSRRFGSTGLDDGLDIDVDDNGNVFVIGSFHASVDFGGGPLNAAGSESDVFVAKFDAAGQHLWSQRFGDVDSDVGLGISADEGNNLLVTGWFDGSVDFGGGVLVSDLSRDIFLAKVDSQGNHLWSMAFGGSQEDEGRAVDAADEVVLTGGFEDTFFGPTDKDAFIAKFLGRDPWPAEAEASATNLTSVEGPGSNDFYDDLSAGVWNPLERKLWLARNGPGSNSKIWVLVEDGAGGWEVDTQGALRGEWTGFGDAEGITQARLDGDVVYIIQESQQKIEEWDLSTYETKVQTNEWDVASHLPLISNDGGEGITFVPDNYLARVGFVDQNGLPYLSTQGMGGLMFVGRQDGGGGLFAFDLNPTGTFVFVGEYRIFPFDDPVAYPTPFYEASGLEFDRSSGLLYAWHGPPTPPGIALSVHDLRSTAVAGQSYRLLNTVQVFDGPSSANYEGFALVSDGSCSTGARESFSTIDDAGSSSLLLYTQFPCAIPVPEPGEMLLLTAGLIGLAGLARLRSRGSQSG